MKKDFKDIARWIAILPVSIIAFFVGNAIPRILVFIQVIFQPSSNPQDLLGVRQPMEDMTLLLILYIGAPALGAMLSVYWGVIIAPKDKKIVALILGGINIFLAFLIAFILESPDKTELIFAFIGSTIGAVFIVYKFFTAGDKFRWLNKED